MDTGTALNEALKLIPKIVPVIRDLLAAGRTPDEIVAHISGLGPAARLDADQVALDEAKKIREGQS